MIIRRCLESGTKGGRVSALYLVTRRMREFVKRSDSLGTCLEVA